jgi:hypothetical protein
MAAEGLEKLLDGAALDVASRAYDNFKAHARFAETQRWGFFIAYFGVTGAVSASILNRLFSNEILDQQTRWIMGIVLCALIVVGILVGMAVVKLGTVFSRNYDQGEHLVRALRLSATHDERLQNVLECSSLPTLGDLKKKAGHFGTAAAYIYIISFSIGLKSAAVAALMCVDSSRNASRAAAMRLSWCDSVLILVVFLSATMVAYRSARWLERFLSPPRGRQAEGPTPGSGVDTGGPASGGGSDSRRRAQSAHA